MKQDFCPVWFHSEMETKCPVAPQGHRCSGHKLWFPRDRSRAGLNMFLSSGFVGDFQCRGSRSFSDSYLFIFKRLISEGWLWLASAEWWMVQESVICVMGIRHSFSPDDMDLSYCSLSPECLWTYMLCSHAERIWLFYTLSLQTQRLISGWDKLYLAGIPAEYLTAQHLI